MKTTKTNILSHDFARQIIAKPPQMFMIQTVFVHTLNDGSNGIIEDGFFLFVKGVFLCAPFIDDIAQKQPKNGIEVGDGFDVILQDGKVIAIMQGEQFGPSIKSER